MTGLDAHTNGTTAAGVAEGHSGRAGATGVRRDAASAAAAIAPATGSPAGVKTLVTTMDDRLAGMQRQLDATKAQNQLLATRMRQIAMAYRHAGQASQAGMLRGISGMPSLGTSGGGGGGLHGLERSSTMPGIRNSQNSRRTPPSSQSAWGTYPFSFSGQGAENVRAAIRAALDRKGIRDPAARARWEAGMMLVAQRESNFRDVVNTHDSNARAGNASGGPFQFVASTYRAYQDPGTSSNHRDTLGQACAFINYAMRRYGVSVDGLDLAARIQQADPRRSPKGY